jgi:hypothetical protein
MCCVLLSKPFTTSHPVDNVFNGVNFGSWEKGTLVAWVDDFMHSRKAGIFEYLGVLMLHPFTEKSSNNVENHIQEVVGSIQRPAQTDFPRWQIQSGFSNQALLTHSEKVGTVFLLAVSLQFLSIRNIFS